MSDKKSHELSTAAERVIDRCPSCGRPGTVIHIPPGHWCLPHWEIVHDDNRPDFCCFQTDPTGPVDNQAAER